MALNIKDRVKEAAAAPGTGAVTLLGAVAGFQSFATIGNGNSTFYCIADQFSGPNWEVGVGTYSSIGPTLTRTTILASSNSGSLVNFASGTQDVFVTYPAEKSVNLDAAGNVSALGTVSSGTWNGSTIPVAYGGTGVTTSSGANSVMLRDANQNVSINRLNQSSTTTTAAGTTTTLTAASTFSQILNGTGGQTFKLPDATTLTNTTTFEFNNNATGVLTIVDNASGAVGTIASGGAAAIALLSNGTVGGTWDVHAYIPENVTWGTNALALSTTVITGGTWNGGTIASGYGGTGLTTFSAANNALYSTGASTLTAGTLPILAGGTGSTTASGARTNLGAAASGANSDITSLSGLTTPLSVGQGGTGLSSITTNRVPYGNGTGALQTSVNFTYDGTTLLVGNSGGLAGVTNPIVSSVGGANNYVQSYIYNTTNGVNSSADFTAYPSNGTDASGWVDLGITSLTFNQAAYSVTGPNESYLFGSSPSTAGTSVTGNLVYATDSNGSANSHQWYVGGFNQAKSAWKMQLTSTGLQLANALSTSYGGTGATTAQGGMNTLAGAVTSGQYLRGNGTNVVMSAIQAADVPTLNQSTTGNAATATNVAGGAANQIPYQTAASTSSFITAPTTSSTFLQWNGTAFTWASAGGGITLTDDTTTNATYYPTFATATSGTAAGVKVSSTKLTFNPSTGTLSVNGISIGRGNGGSANNIGIGAGALSGNATGPLNLAVGQNALAANTTAAYNVAIGAQAAAAVTTSSRNTVVGYGAGAANTTGGDYMVAIGFTALAATTTGYGCTAVGTYALTANTTGINTSVGTFSLQSNTTGTANTAVGYSALAANIASNNTAIGNNALAALSSSSGLNNTAIGSAALSVATSAANNVAVGYNALSSATTAATNVAVGNQSLPSLTTGSDNVAIGLGAMFTASTGSSNTVVGRSAFLGGNGNNNTCIGYSAMSNATAVYNNTAVGQSAMLFTTTGSYNTGVGNQALYNVRTGSGNTAVNPMNSAGTYAPVFDPNTESNRFCMGSTGVTNAYIQVAWTVVSDARDKTDFASVPHGLDFVAKINPIAYRYKETREATEGHGPVRYGFKAQEILALEGKDSVIVDAEDSEKLRFNDQSLLAVLVNAIKELNIKVEAQALEIATLKGK